MINSRLRFRFPFIQTYHGFRFPLVCRIVEFHFFNCDFLFHLSKRTTVFGFLSCVVLENFIFLTINHSFFFLATHVYRFVWRTGLGGASVDWIDTIVGPRYMESLES